MPVVNLRANYAAADQSHKTEESRLYRALFEQLPHGAAVVSQDYSVDSALQYMMFTGAGDGKDIARIGFGSQAVRDAARDKRRVFAFTTAATFLAAEGLRFERVPLVMPHSARILEEYPKGTLVVGAAAGVPVPFELLGSPQRRPRALASARQNNAFAFVTGGSETAPRRGQSTGLAESGLDDVRQTSAQAVRAASRCRRRARSAHRPQRPDGRGSQQRSRAHRDLAGWRTDRRDRNVE